jgi:hypothetical protein
VQDGGELQLQEEVGCILVRVSSYISLGLVFCDVHGEDQSL